MATVARAERLEVRMPARSRHTASPAELDRSKYVR